MFGIALEQWDKRDEGRQGRRVYATKRWSLKINIERLRQVPKICEWLGITTDIVGNASCLARDNEGVCSKLIYQLLTLLLVPDNKG